MNKKDLEANGNKVIKPVGTGPYKWVEWVKDSKVVLDRFDGYSSAAGPVAENIHAANERVKIESVIETAKVYALFLAHWCGLVEKWK
jgi:ABC-type transport system substrate-binding protein